jgi:proteasome lid subunit RPN8/RPN11
MAWFRRQQPKVAVAINIRLLSRPRKRRPHRSAESAPLIIPTDLMVTAWRQLFPAERMLVFGGRRPNEGICLTSVVDVTEAKPSLAHVNASAARMTQTLIDLEHTGAHLAVWMHSHPGEGPRSTYPSEIDLNQQRELQQHYSRQLVGIIAVRDGWLRLWGSAIEGGNVRVLWNGSGIEPHREESNVFRVALA